MTKHFLFLALLVAILTALFSICPWWFLSFGTFFICFCLAKNAWEALGASFLGVAVVWFAWAGWIHLANQGVMASRIGAMIGLSSAPLLLLITALIGGTVGATAGLSGYLLKQT